MNKDFLFLEDSDILINSSVIDNKTKITDNIEISKIDLSKEDAKKINKPKGLYTTITFNKEAVGNEIEKLLDLLKNEIKNTFDYLKVKKNKKILFVGLGNKNITLDKLGFLTIEKISVSNNTYKIYKDVEGLTNIDTINFIKSLVKDLEIDLVVLIDSLKAHSIERIGSTVQISTSGLNVGSKKEISKKTIKANTISIGVPTLIDMKEINDINPSLLITTMDIDDIVDNSSSIISIAINKLI